MIGIPLLLLKRLILFLGSIFSFPTLVVPLLLTDFDFLLDKGDFFALYFIFLLPPGVRESSPEVAKILLALLTVTTDSLELLDDDIEDLLLLEILLLDFEEFELLEEESELDEELLLLDELLELLLLSLSSSCFFVHVLLSSNTSFNTTRKPQPTRKSFIGTYLLRRNLFHRGGGVFSNSALGLASALQI